MPSALLPFALVCILCQLCAFGGCTRKAPASPLAPQVSGTIELAGLSAPVRIVRDRWGVPHIYAQTRDDLFFAQGFVQAQDRLFQMDLWRRAALGRLADVLGANFIERDTMTRRIQYRGDPGAEWASYAVDARAIAEAFVRGINAWVARARARPPEEFVRAGWLPAYWAAADLLTRTDAFVESGDAIEEVHGAGLSDVVADAIRSVGTPPFFVGTGPSEPATRTNAVSRASAASGKLTFSEARRRLEAPSSRYLVHLVAPGWNVIGAASPWRPGVAFGHNDRVAWAMTPTDADTQDVYVEHVGGAPIAAVKDGIRVKGRAQWVSFRVESTRHGVIVSSDRERGLAFTVRWSGFEPGAAAEIGALALDRARTWADFRQALARWTMPARRVVYADVDGNTAFQDAALVPVRRGGEWVGWKTLDELPHGFSAREVHAAPGPNRPVVEVGPSHSKVEAPAPPDVGQNAAVFAHVLGVTPAEQRFNVGPLGRPAVDESVVRGSIDLRAWDRSRVLNAPGQSGSRASAHYDDAAKFWSAGEAFPLPFSEETVRANAEATLILTPTIQR